MSGAPWFPFYPSDFLAGVAGLAAPEIGVYTVLLALMYDGGGPIECDEPRLARRCGISTRQFSSLLAELIKQGKIDEEAGHLFNKRAESELRKREARSATASQSANRRWRKSEENQATGHADGSLSHVRTPCAENAARARSTTTTTTIEPPLEVLGGSAEGLGGSVPAPRTATRARALSQISADAEPNSQDYKAAKDAGLDADACRAEWLRFRDYHRARGSLMADWSAAWRCWLSNMDRYQRARWGPATRPRSDPILEAANDLWGQHGKLQISSDDHPIDVGANR